MRKLLLSIAAIAVVAATIWLMRHTPPRAADEASAESARQGVSSDEWRRELAQMRRELARLKWNQLAMASAAGRDPVSHEPGEAESEHGAEPEHEEASAMPPMSIVEQRAAQADLLREQMHQEGIDPEWKRYAEVQMRERLAARPMTGAVRTDIECRASLCRLDVIVDSIDVRDEAIAVLPEIVPWDFDGYYYAADDDERHMIVYVTREGATLPRIPTAPSPVEPGANVR